MGKRRQKEAINGEFRLPEPILHRIQSFLTAKEAARTAILSKSWCSAWSTRPNINLDRDDYRFKLSEFMEFAKKTIQRYEQSNLKIESFRIRTGSPSRGVDGFGDFINEMISRALRIGATHISTQQNDTFPIVVLTNEVFEAENLGELSARSCKINNLVLDRKVRCSKLESLSLDHVHINSAMISHIASCCPLIEKLSLCNISSFFNDDDDHDNVCGCGCGGGDDYNYLFLSDLSSKFPSLKELTLKECKAQEVSSRTLERLNFTTSSRRAMSVKFDVPSIRKFAFVGGDVFPSLSFVSVSREWESDVSLNHDLGNVSISTSWFRSLNKLLTELSLSKIHLFLNIDSSMSFDYVVGDIRGLTKPEVENLTIMQLGLQYLSCYALLDGLFRICRPKKYLYSKYGNPEKQNLLCKTLVRGLTEKCMYGLQDLEEVNVQLFDDDVHAWRPLKLESLFDAFSAGWTSFLDVLLSSRGKYQEIRFQLKWKTQNT